MGSVWLILAAAVLAALALLAIHTPRRREYVELARRRLLVGAVLCAASFVGACRWIGAGQALTPQKPTKLSVLAGLGEIWRAMRPHATGAVRDAEGYEALGKQMETAIEDLKTHSDTGEIKPATAAALEAAFRDRYFHIRRSKYSMASCYEMTMLGGSLQASRAAMEEQANVLNDLAKRGKLPSSATEKARAVLAKELAFQMQANELWSGDSDWKAQDELHKRYERGAIEATDATTEAAKTLVDFTTKPTGSA